MNESKLNGSADLLAQAFRKVVEDATEGALEPMLDEMGKMEERLTERIDTGLKTTNENMQGQFAAQEKQIASLKQDVASLK